MSYQGMKDAIKRELNQIAESFVEIGYRLKEIRDKELYKIDGYRNINEFAQAEYNLSQSTTSRFIAINDNFSVNGSSPKLLEQFEGYGFSKLSEMLTLSEEDLRLVSIRTTRAEIREIKQAKKEAENEIYAPAHNARSTDFTQLNGTFEGEKTYIIPDAGKLLIELFRDKSKRVVLKEMAAVLSDSWTNEAIAKAAELINPSGHLLFRKGMIVLIFEEDHIKYNKFGAESADYTYKDFLNDLFKTFDMSLKDPWVAFYGEPIPEPEQPKKETVPEKKDIKSQATAKPVNKKPEKKAPTTHHENDEDEEDEDEKDEPETIPGQQRITDYPEYIPDKNEVIQGKLEEAIETEYNTEILPEIENYNVEVVEADIVETPKEECDIETVNINFDKTTGELEILLKSKFDIKVIKVIDTITGESWEVSIG
ncbi:MAG: hypothetical protein K0R92_544 [Lachnospiraceae bacterium]|nr:hypothetical protein [Lachnospiraceae bacterium]